MLLAGIKVLFLASEQSCQGEAEVTLLNQKVCMWRRDCLRTAVWKSEQASLLSTLPYSTVYPRPPLTELSSQRVETSSFLINTISPVFKTKWALLNNCESQQGLECNNSTI
nr:alpha-(1,3)-fucosyltransferase 9 isoform X2 [Microcebus murinus]